MVLNQKIANQTLSDYSRTLTNISTSKQGMYLKISANLILELTSIQRLLSTTCELFLTLDLPVSQ
jgi:hypothetical protein